MAWKVKDLYEETWNKSEQIEVYTTFLGGEKLYPNMSNHPKSLYEFSIISVDSQTIFNWIKTCQISYRKVNAQEMVRKVWKEQLGYSSF